MLARKIILVAALLLSVAFVGPTQVAMSSVDVNVTANPLWTDTGLSVTDGEAIIITAFGLWTFHEPDNLCDPNGIYGGGSDEFLNNGAVAMLIAFVGPDPYQGDRWGTHFFPQDSNYWGIGSSGHFISDKAGELWLGFNDDAVSKNITDNNGSVTAHISTVAAGDCVPVIIYVDKSKTDGNGTSWQDAYPALEQALARASQTVCKTEIWVAGGAYTPTTRDRDGYLAFLLPYDVHIYGHFKGGETSLEQRDLSNPANETILQGSDNSDRVVYASRLSLGTILDGFTVKGGTVSGIEIIYGGLTVNHCLITENVNYGVLTTEADIKITNSVIYNNGCGIYLSSSPYSADITIGNCTIVNNAYCGFSTNINAAPKVFNCIIWENNTNYDSSYPATYSCIQEDYPGQYPGTGNIHSDPCFANKNANDFHLRPASLCIDAGDPNFNDFNDTDIDGECRIMFGKSAIRVDIGADELDWPKADFNRNKIVNFIDYAAWAPAWKTTDPNKSLDLDNDVDIDDLSKFCDDWLWQATWQE